MAGVVFQSNVLEISKRIARNFSDAAEELRDEAVEWVQEQMLYGYRDRHGPDGHTEIVDTGALFDSLRGEVKRESQNMYTVSVGTDKSYAVFVHQGTYKLKARPFIRDALEKHRADIKSIMEENGSKGF